MEVETVTDIVNSQWKWNLTYLEPVIVIDSLYLNSIILDRIWIPSLNIIENQDSKSNLDIQSSPPNSKNDIRFLASALKIIDLMNNSNLKSPIASNVKPLPHQIRCLNKIMGNKQKRFLLADEVGLGKTIEAGLVLKELKLRNEIKKILIVVPRGLITQWKKEMINHFDEVFVELKRDDDLQLWDSSEQIITSLDSIKPVKNHKGSNNIKNRKINKKLYENIYNKKWNLIIIDEAHKVAGSIENVSRHKLGVHLSRNSKYLLLLSATPHQGKTDSFLRLMTLLDEAKFSESKTIDNDSINPYVIRTEKRNALDHDGKPLFTPRYSKMIVVKWGEKHNKQKLLYEKVSDYFSKNYMSLIKEKKYHMGFLLILFQRMVASSSFSIMNALSKRLVTLTQENSDLEGIEPIELFDTTDDSYNNNIQINFKNRISNDEKVIIEDLLKLSQDVVRDGIDAKTDYLIDLLQNLRLEAGSDGVKFLIFTEFRSTQQMLRNHLERWGFSVTVLNGSMNMFERERSKDEFFNHCDVMISTEAGGEGLNLQFCNIVINYDLPWNPMRIEQRIGRVDRIGQSKDVRVFNFVHSDTVEQRVHEILIEKLLTILNDLGFDKYADILDSEADEEIFKELFIKTIIQPELTDKYLEDFSHSLRVRAESDRNALSKIAKEADETISNNHIFDYSQISALTETMVASYLMRKGGTISTGLFGYNILWPDKTIMENFVFDKSKYCGSNNLLTIFSDPIRKILYEHTTAAFGRPIPSVVFPGLSDKVNGLWSLWMVKTYIEGTMKDVPISCFIDKGGKVLNITSAKIWTELNRGEFDIVGKCDIEYEMYEYVKNVIVEKAMLSVKNEDDICEMKPVIFLNIGE